MNQIKCLKCGNIIDLNQELEKQLELKGKELEFDFEKRRELLRKEFEKRELEAREKIALEFQKRDEEQKRALQEEFQNRAKIEQLELKEQLKRQKEQIDELVERLSVLLKQKSEFEQYKNEEELRAIEIKNSALNESKKRYEELLSSQREQVAKEIMDKNEIVLKQKELENEALKKQIDELKEKSDLSSFRLRGEAMEVAIEEFLRDKFKDDEIREVAKGAAGADVIHEVFDRKRLNSCGKIFYESKRTKHFGSDWVTKLKEDLRRDGGDIGVIVTKAMPNGIDRVGIVDGVWICGYDEFKSLSFALRESLVAINRVANANENKDEKVQQLYNYLISNSFLHQMQGVLDAFEQMESSLKKEKSAITALWSKREKSIEQAKFGAIDIYTNLKIISGNKIGRIANLELESLIEDKKDE